MANFVLIYTGGSMAENAAEQEKVMQAWGVWFGQLGANLVDGGKPFTGMVKTVESEGKVSDGSAGTMATGYTVITADSLDAAVEMSKSCPVFAGGGKVSVYETSDVM